MKQNITFITLGVVHLEMSIDFYENKLGWKRSELSNDQLIVFNTGGILLSLYDRKALAEDATVSSDGKGFKGYSLSHNVNSEAEVDKIIHDLRTKGVTIIKEPQKVFWGGYSSYFSDPDGNLWEVAYNPFLNTSDL